MTKCGGICGSEDRGLHNYDSQVEMIKSSPNGQQIWELVKQHYNSEHSRMCALCPVKVAKKTLELRLDYWRDRLKDHEAGVEQAKAKIAAIEGVL